MRNVCLRSGFRILETFSAIVDIQGQGPAGSELHLEDQGKRVAATLRGYRGKAIPVVTKLQGSIEKSSRWGEGPPVARCDRQARTTEVRWKLRGITPAYFKASKE